jgi:hypothetical protein
MHRRLAPPLFALFALIVSGCYARAGYGPPGYYRAYPTGYYGGGYYGGYYGPRYHGYYGPRYYGPRGYYGYPEAQRYRPYVQPAPPAYGGGGFGAPAPLPAPAHPYVAPPAR